MHKTQLHTSPLELGINWVDTAAAYGFGRSERVVGQALAGLSERPYVFTKCSLLDDGTGRVRHSLKRDSVLRAAEASLRRLGTDAIDLYQIHSPAADGAITGFRRPEQVGPIVAAAGLELTGEDLSQIEASG